MICENRNRDFFKEIKKLNPKVAVAPCIDGYTDYNDIAEHLAGKFNTLYNSVPSDEKSMDRIKYFIHIHCGDYKSSGCC